MQNAPSSILAVALVVLLLLIAFSSGTEVAMLSANRYKIRAAAKAGKRTAKVLDALLTKPTAGWARTWWCWRWPASRRPRSRPC